jgi:hypothetical protein
MTPSGHERLKIVAVQTDPEPHFAGGKSLMSIGEPVLT